MTCMLPVDRQESALYAERYAQWKLTGTRYLPLREVPGVIRRHVEDGITTLDYGCGPGDTSKFLKSLGLQVDGADINANMLSQARRKMPEGDFQQVKNGRIPAADGHYDLVFSSWVLVEIGSKRELVDTVREMVRVLKPNGTFIALVCSEDYYNRDWLSTNTEFEENKNLSSGCVVKVRFKDIGIGVEHFFWTDSDYREVMQEAGLRLVETRHPLGTDDDGYPWISEKFKSPTTIYVGKKKQN